MKQILLLCMLGFSLLASAQQLNCQDFRNGKFQITDSIVGNSIIERQGDYQLEYGEKSELKLVFEVEWLDDCTYTLKLKEVLENPQEISIPEDMVLRVEILETSENSYLQESTSNLWDIKLQSEMVRIE